jgi:hypothetical protein
MSNDVKLEPGQATYLAAGGHPVMWQSISTNREHYARIEAAMLDRLVPQLRAENERLKALRASSQPPDYEPWKTMTEESLRREYESALRHCWSINAEYAALEDATRESVTDDEWSDLDFAGVVRFLHQRRTQLQADAERLQAENERLRYLLWLHHGHMGLYGDDGEMQCPHCRLDFKRNPIAALESAFERQAIERAAKWSKSEPTE